MFYSFRRLSSILDPGERPGLVVLLGMMLISGLVEMAGAASVLPLLVAISSPESLRQTSPGTELANLFGVSNQHGLLIMLCAISLILVIGGQVLKGVTSYLIVRFGKRQERLMSARVFQGIMEKRYEWFLHQNSSVLAKSVLGDVSDLVHGALVPALYIISHGAMFVCVVGFLLAFSASAALVMGVIIGGAYGLVLFLAQRFLRRFGAERAALIASRQKIVAECFSGIKEVKLRGVERYFFDAFDAPSSRLAQLHGTVTLLGELPRYVLEALVFGTMIVFLLILLTLSNGNFISVLPTLGLFAFAGVRLFPTLQLLYANVTSLQFHRHTIESLAGSLQPAALVSSDLPLGYRRPAPIRLRREIRLERVSFAYPEAGLPSLRELTLSIPAQSTVGIVGRTGAGKTTLVDIILGLLAPQSGTLSIDGATLGENQRKRWQQSIGYVPQQIFLADDTVRANIAFGIPLAEIDDQAIRRAARLANIDEFITSELPDGYNTVVGERGIRLSGGQRQRIGIARALYHEPSLIVFDEATSALDNITERAVMEAIANIGRSVTVVVVAHRWTSVKYCDRIFVIDRGQCVGVGSYRELADNNPKFQELMLG